MMNGDNFRAVSAEVEASVLAQHFAILRLWEGRTDQPNGYSALAAQGAPDRRLVHGKKHGGEFTEISVPSARRIAMQVAEKHGLTLKDMGSLTRANRELALRAKAARYEFWARCKAEIVICGAPASYHWIAGLTGHSHTSIVTGVRCFRREVAA